MTAIPHRLLRAALLVAACLLLLCGGAQAALTPVTLQLRWFHQFQFAGYYAALDQGFYQEAGLDVTIVERDLAVNPVDAVLEGKADFGVSNSEILLHWLRGKPVTALAAVFQHSPLALVTRAEEGIRTVHDLIGKRIFISTRSTDVEILAMLKHEGIGLGMLRVKEGFARPSDYLDPDVDAIAAYTINQPYYLERAGVPYHVIHPASYGIDFYGDTLFTSQVMVDAHPEVVEAFRRASMRGWRHAMEHVEATVDLILQKYGSQKSREHLLYEAEHIRELMLPNLVDIGHTNPGRWRHIAETFSTLGMAEATDDLSDFLYDPRADKLAGLTKTLYLLGALLGVALLAAGVLGVFLRRLRREVAERRRAEEELARLGMSLRQVIDLGPHRICVKDGEGCLLLVNKAMAESLGSTPDALIGKRLDEVHADPGEALLMLEADRQVLESGISSTTEETRTEADGEIRHFQTVRVPYVGTLTTRPAVLVMAMDVTEQHTTRELLVQSEKMLSIGGLAAGMAHEINNPLGMILGAMQNAERRLHPDLAANQAVAEEVGIDLVALRGYMERRNILRSFEIIHEAGARAGRIVQSMLEYSRKTDERATPENINTLLDRALELASSDYDLSRKYDFRAIRIERDYDPDLPPAPVLRQEIEQVFLNLIRNAAEAMTDARQEHAPVIELRTSQSDGLVRVEVRDNGPGMDPATRKHALEPFYTTRGESVGTGLGLSIAYFIVTSHHGGGLTIESQPGSGTSFLVTLPLTNPALTAT